MYIVNAAVDAASVSLCLVSSLLGTLESSRRSVVVDYKQVATVTFVQLSYSCLATSYSIGLAC
jgi:hypothetical protein